jgi:hypothetical protein
MGSDIAYLPAFYLNEEIDPAGAPFILTDDCNRIALQPTDPELKTVRLLSTTRRKQLSSTDGVAQSFLAEGREYELSYWDGGWQSLGLGTAGAEGLDFDGVPSDHLYWLVATDSDRDERIFTLDEGLQTWW